MAKTMSIISNGNRRFSRRSSKSRQTPSDDPSWDKIIPAIFFAASAACFVDPTKAPSIFFALLGFMTIFISPVMNFLAAPVTEGLTGTVTASLDAFTADENGPRRERLYESLADLLSTSLYSSPLRDAVRQFIVESLTSEELHDSALNTLQTALIKASENEGLRSAALLVVRQAFVGALNDEAFVRDLMSSIVGAMVQASREEELTQSFLDVVTTAVTKALADERFVMELRGAITDTLKDGEIYKAGARGMVSAAFGSGVIQKTFLGEARTTTR